MKPPLGAIMLIAAFTAAGLSHAESPNPKKKATSSDPASNKKDAVSLAPRSPGEMKQIFSYFPYPQIPSQYRFAKINATGSYRLTIDPQGNVTEIKILKRMGVFRDWAADVDMLKTLIRWRAKAGPARIVDVSWTMFTLPPYITNEGSHIPRR